jgi:hypothetical protein
MSDRPETTRTNLVLAIVVVLLVVGGLIAYAIAGTRSVATSVSSNGSSATLAGGEWAFFNSTISPDGLQLEVALNTTSLPAGQGLSARAYLTNTLPRNVSLPVNLAAFPGDPALEALGRGYQCHGAGLLGMLSFGLYQGRYTAANFSQEAVPLILEAPLAHTCPNPYYYVQSNQSVEFAPNSDMATLSGQKTTRVHMSLATINCTTGTYAFGPSTVVENGSTTTFSAGTGLSWGCGPAYEGLRGYWALPPDGYYITVNDRSNSTILQSLKEAYDLYREFAPGPYTVVAEDYWNQTVFAHFEVRAGPSSSLAEAACVVPIPAGGTLDPYFHNSTFAGDEVTLANGTQRFYSYFSCPRPVSPNVYAMAVAAVTNSTFVASENGSQFILLHASLVGCCNQDAEQYVQLYFFHYGGPSDMDSCGGALENQTSPYLMIPDNPNPAWALHDPTIQVMSSCQQLMGNFETGVVSNYGA